MLQTQTSLEDICPTSFNTLPHETSQLESRDCCNLETETDHRLSFTQVLRRITHFAPQLFSCIFILFLSLFKPNCTPVFLWYKKGYDKKNTYSMIFANLCYGTLLCLGVLKQLTLPFSSFTWEDSKNYSAYNPTVTSSKGVVLNMPRIDFLF